MLSAWRNAWRPALVSVVVLAAAPAIAAAQPMHGAPRDTAATRAEHDHSTMTHDHAAMGHDMSHMTGMAGMDMGEMDHAMKGLFGGYAMTREASGTSWQPEASPHEGVHLMRGDWVIMVHGMAQLVADHQGGDRGDDKVFASNMLMTMATRPLGPGSLGLRSMV